MTSNSPVSTERRFRRSDPSTRDPASENRGKENSPKSPNTRLQDQQQAAKNSGVRRCRQPVKCCQWPRWCPSWNCLHRHTRKNRMNKTSAAVNLKKQTTRCRPLTVRADSVEGSGFVGVLCNARSGANTHSNTDTAASKQRWKPYRVARCKQSRQRTHRPP